MLKRTRIRKSSGQVHPMDRVPGAQGSDAVPPTRYCYVTFARVPSPLAPQSFGVPVLVEENLVGGVLAEQLVRQVIREARRITGDIARSQWTVPPRLWSQNLQLTISQTWPCYRYLVRYEPLNEWLPAIALSPSTKRQDVPYTVAHEMGHHVHRHHRLRFLTAQTGQWSATSGIPGTAAVRRLQVLYKAWLREARLPAAHRAVAYFSTISQGPGRILASGAPRGLSPNRAGQPNHRDPSASRRRGWDEFLAECFAITAMRGRDRRRRRLENETLFRNAFPEALQAYWKAFHGSHSSSPCHLVAPTDGPRGAARAIGLIRK